MGRKHRKGHLSIAAITHRVGLLIYYLCGGHSERPPSRSSLPS
jgi:hypothetical protein